MRGRGGGAAGGHGRARRQAGGHAGGRLLLLLDHVLVADGAEALRAGVGVEPAAVAALHGVLVRLLVHLVCVLGVGSGREASLYCSFSSLL